MVRCLRPFNPETESRNSSGVPREWSPGVAIRFLLRGTCAPARYEDRLVDCAHFIRKSTRAPARFSSVFPILCLALRSPGGDLYGMVFVGNERQERSMKT